MIIVRKKIYLKITDFLATRILVIFRKEIFLNPHHARFPLIYECK